MRLCEKEDSDSEKKNVLFDWRLARFFSFYSFSEGGRRKKEREREELMRNEAQAKLVEVI